MGMSFRLSRNLLLRSAVSLVVALSLARGQSGRSDIPRLPDGRPDFQGTWFKVGGFGLTGAIIPTEARGGGARGAAGGGGGGARGAASTNEFFLRGVRIPYLPEAILEKRWRQMNQYMDGEPRCHLAGVPRAAEQPPYPHAIIQDENYLTILYEYVHEPRIIPLDNSSHPRNYWAWDGDSRGRWEGDTLVVDVTNFNGRTWLDMTGNFVDENLHVVERYTLKDTNTYTYEATLTDPTVFSETWQIKFDVRRQPEAEQLLEYSCLEGEGDREHYTEDAGGLKPNLAGPAAARAQAGASSAQGQYTISGCLRGELDKGDVRYALAKASRGNIPLSPDPSIGSKLLELIDREVRVNGNWEGRKPGSGRFFATSVRVLAEGCSRNGR
ncbi:MAG: hypothetical protein AUI91_07005 [Acidobacteria bacterium 13_1_40CM_3_56_11]|nr:MAG: hypothetical protein AUH28_10560 [Acidobacteria bacterium 13_1_40CM_56_16]OLD20359.1 MAG: hypothetical protein AUI91_07005 [Acidobacteria bacterium 13_1_40CM_3_56_11]